jgi:hypothetical protein
MRSFAGKGDDRSIQADASLVVAWVKRVVRPRHAGLARASPSFDKTISQVGDDIVDLKNEVR